MDGLFELGCGGGGGDGDKFEGLHVPPERYSQEELEWLITAIKQRFTADIGQYTTVDGTPFLITPKLMDLIKVQTEYAHAHRVTERDVEDGEECIKAIYAIILSVKVVSEAVEEIAKTHSPPPLA